MRILLIGMHFYEYEEKIKEELENLGYSVDIIYDSVVSKKKYIPDFLFNFINHCYQQLVLKKIVGNKYDKIIVLVGRYLCVETLKKLKRDRKTELILYLWDDIQRVENFEITRNYYDKIFSFDRIDCQNNGFIFLPLFYTHDFFIEKKGRCKIDLYSSFWNHSDRISIARKILEQDNFGRRYFFYILVGKKDYIKIFFNKSIFRRAELKQINFSTQKLAYEKNVINMKDAFAVLDIQFPSQRGLTLRTIEALGTKSKIITTNKDIANYDFYNPQNICIIDRENPVVPDIFWNTPYKDLEENLYKKYSLDNWIKTLLV